MAAWSLGAWLCCHHGGLVGPLAETARRLGRRDSIAHGRADAGQILGSLAGAGPCRDMAAGASAAPGHYGPSLAAGDAEPFWRMKSATCAGATILLAAMHMVVEALFWFHPLVWWLGSAPDRGARECLRRGGSGLRQRPANLCREHSEGLPVLFAFAARMRVRGIRRRSQEKNRSDHGKQICDPPERCEERSFGGLRRHRYCRAARFGSADRAAGHCAGPGRAVDAPIPAPRPPCATRLRVWRKARPTLTMMVPSLAQAVRAESRYIRQIFRNGAP